MKQGTPALTLAFFHDVVCGWCFNLSPRLHALADEFDLDIRHRSFVLQDSPERMVEVFGSPATAKETILRHWSACAASSETPERFAIERMRAAPFDYPHGLPAALACQAAQRLDGQPGHWRLFDALQAAHLSEARKVADVDVLVDVAREAGFPADAFHQAMLDPFTRECVEADRRLAWRLEVRSVPTVIVHETGARLLRNGPLDELRAQLREQVGRPGASAGTGHTSAGGRGAAVMTCAGDLLLTALAPVVWGSTYYVTTEWLPAGVPMTLAMVRRLPPRHRLVQVLVLGTLNFAVFWTLLTFTAWQLTAGGLVLLPMAWVAEPALPAFKSGHVMGLVYLGLIGAALTYFLWFRGLARLGPATVSILALLSPVTAVVIGWLALAQSLSPLQAVGMLVVLASVAAGQWATARAPFPGRGPTGPGRRPRLRWSASQAPRASQPQWPTPRRPTFAGPPHWPARSTWSSSWPASGAKPSCARPCCCRTIPSEPPSACVRRWTGCGPASRPTP